MEPERAEFHYLLRLRPPIPRLGVGGSHWGALALRLCVRECDRSGGASPSQEYPFNLKLNATALSVRQGGEQREAKVPSVAKANSIRPCRLASLQTRGEAQTCEEQEALGADWWVTKRPGEAVRWLETEGTEGLSHEAERPARREWIEDRNRPSTVQESEHP